MSENHEKKEMKQPETMEGFCDKIVNKAKDIELGELLAEGENLFDRARKLDKQITGNAKGLVSKVTGYFRDSVDSHRKTGK